MHARIHGHIWEQPYRESREEGNSRELPRAYPFPSLPLPPGKGREGKVIPTLFRSVDRPIFFRTSVDDIEYLSLYIY